MVQAKGPGLRCAPGYVYTALLRHVPEVSILSHSVGSVSTKSLRIRNDSAEEAPTISVDERLKIPVDV